MTTITAIIPTYQRWADLERCLSGLSLQVRPLDQIIVVLRSSDIHSTRVAATWKSQLPIDLVHVTGGGQVAALNAGLEAARGDLIMITDDDTIPRSTWTTIVEKRFSEAPRLGGVGGRDIVHEGACTIDSSCKVVGKILWYGRFIGNHHLAAQRRCLVDVLKGANMAFRAKAIAALRFDTGLRGSGAQVSNDLAFSLAVKRKGWQLLYDPECIVDHFPAPRSANEMRGKLDHQTVSDGAYNFARALRRHMTPGPRQAAAIAWETCIGTQGRPGYMRGAWARLTGDHELILRAQAAQQGRIQASKELV